GLNQEQRFVPRYRYRYFLLGKLGNPKVEHFHVSVRPEHDVLRFNIAMDNSRLMCGGERTRHLDGDINSFTQLHSSAHQTLTQRLAFDQFAGYVINCVILADLVNGQDIWMIEPYYCVRFLLKALQALGVAGKAKGQEFKRGLATGNNVGGQIDFTHPPGADRFRNFVVTDRLTDEGISSPILNNRVIPMSRDYSLLGQRPERCSEHAACAQSFRCVRKDFGTALSADSDYCDHDRRIARAHSPSLYCVKIYRTLSSYYRN